MAQQAKQLELETVSPFEKFKDLTKRLFSVTKDDLNEARKQEGNERPIQKESCE